MVKANGDGMPQGLLTVLKWIIGLAVAALILVIMLIIFGNLVGNLGFGQESTAFTNETITWTDAGVTPATAQGRVNGVLTNVIVTNKTGGEVISSGNYTISGVLISNTTSNYTDVNVSATVSFDGRGKIDTDSVILNYSQSAVNVSAQFPTVGTIIGLAILLLVLIGILAFAIKAMMGIAANPTSATGSFDPGSGGGFA